MLKKFLEPFLSEADDLGGGDNGRMQGQEDEGNEEYEGNEDDLNEGEEGQEEKSVKDNYIPKDVALAWKKELKEAKRQLNSLKEKEYEQQHKSIVDNLKNKVKSKGYDDDLAELFAEMADDLIKAVPKNDPLDAEITEELDEFQNEYPGIHKHKKEILEKIRKYRKVDPDFSVEDAIKLVNVKRSKKSEKEIELEVEQRQAYARRNTDKQPTSSVGSEVRDQYPLSSDDLRILKQMQREKPERGWTKKKYYELMIKNKRR